MRVLIADDHRLMIEGIRLALADYPDIEIVGEATSGSKVLPLVGQTSPDVVLLDIRMPGMDGLTCLELIRRRHPAVKVVMISGSQETDQIQASLKRGASGFIVKTVEPSQIAAILRDVVSGATTAYRAWGTLDIDHDRVARARGLTPREIAILKAVARGLSNSLIAKELWVTEQTVKFHLTNIYRKLDVVNRTAATRFAYQHGLVEPPLNDGPAPRE